VHINNEHGVPDDNNTILAYVKSFNAKVIAFTATSFEFDRVKGLASLIRKHMPDIKLILGGSHATICPKDISGTAFDAFCVGEGEKAFVDFALKVKEDCSFRNIRSLWVRDGKDIIQNPMGDIYMDLNDLPPLDLDIMDTKKLINTRKGWFSISMSRGCPYECSYCINHLYKKLKAKHIPMVKYLRKRTPNSIVKELFDIFQKFPNINTFNFDDDLVMHFESWMFHFTRKYKRVIYDPYSVGYLINARANTLTIGMIRMLKESGCKGVRIGVECGSEKLRANILKKPISNEMLSEAFRNCRKMGLNAEAFLMLGIPTETKRDVMETIRLVADLKPNLIRLSILYPFIHTQIYDFCKKKGLFRKGFNSTDIFSLSPLKFKDMPQRDIVGYHILFPWHLNAHMYPTSPYSKALNAYKRYPLQKLLKSKEKIRRIDMLLDKRFKEPHFMRRT